MVVLPNVKDNGKFFFAFLFAKEREREQVWNWVGEELGGFGRS